MRPNNSRTSERGNVFIFILLGLVLFAALSFTVARGFRSDTTSQMTDRQAELLAAEIITYGQQMERTVNRLRRNGCSENEISFENTDTAVYTFATRDECKIFHPDGGKMKPWTIREELGGSSVYPSYSPWRAGGSFFIDDLGSPASELLFYIGMVNPTLCEAINDKLGVENTGGGLPFNPGSHIHSVFVGNFDDLGNPPAAWATWSNSEPDLVGEATACVDYSDRNPSVGLQLYYHTLIIR